MRAGKLRHRLAIQALVPGSPAQNSSGEPDETWTTLATVWAAIEPLKGREFLAAQQVSSEVTGKITIRYYAGVTAKYRFLYGARIYDIVAPVNVDERNVEMQFYVREGPNNG